jgi:hypothetical protein
MAFGGINYLAVIIAAVAAWILGAAWYGLLAKPWVAAQGKTMEAFKADRDSATGKPASYLPFIIAFLAELVMAWILAGTIGHLGPGQITLRTGIISAMFVWFGFVLTTVAVNNMFAMRRPMLTVIDAGHWLAVLLLMGAIIGAIGV